MLQNYNTTYSVIRITDSGDFWALFDELIDDNSIFLHNRKSILDAYVNGTLYGLAANETDEMSRDHVSLDPIFCKRSTSMTLYLLPCFIVTDKNDSHRAIFLWTHTRARRRGFAKKLVKLLNIDTVYHPLPESIEFWKKCDINN